MRYITTLAGDPVPPFPMDLPEVRAYLTAAAEAREAEARVAEVEASGTRPPDGRKGCRMCGGWSAPPNQYRPRHLPGCRLDELLAAQDARFDAWRAERAAERVAAEAATTAANIPGVVCTRVYSHPRPSAMWEVPGGGTGDWTAVQGWLAGTHAQAWEIGIGR